MKDKKSIYIATAVFSAVSLTATAAPAAGGHYDASKKHCYGAALAGQNDCKSIGETHSCKGNAKENCTAKDWKMAMSQEECDALIAKNCPQNK